MVISAEAVRVKMGLVYAAEAVLAMHEASVVTEGTRVIEPVRGMDAVREKEEPALEKHVLPAREMHGPTAVLDQPPPPRLQAPALAACVFGAFAISAVAHLWWSRCVVWHRAARGVAGSSQLIEDGVRERSGPQPMCAAVLDSCSGAQLECEQVLLDW